MRRAIPGVIKPSEQTPVVTLELAKLAGGVLTAWGFQCGHRRRAGALAGHPGVELVAFTGSDATGAKVGAAAGGALSGIILELGGKSPQVIFGDADLDAAEVGVMTGICDRSSASRASPARASTCIGRSPKTCAYQRLIGVLGSLAGLGIRSTGTPRSGRCSARSSIASPRPRLGDPGRRQGRRRRANGLPTSGCPDGYDFELRDLDRVDSQRGGLRQEGSGP